MTLAIAFLTFSLEKTGLFENLFRKRVSLRNPFSGLMAIDFAQSDGLSQVNQVNSARNQGLTAPNLI
ncbi:MAG: hypothetical protein O9350_02020 [Microcystis sp. LE19-388.1G]|nr:hypothetical protein [Microcystis sp. LE19-388.1G]